MNIGIDARNTGIKKTGIGNYTKNIIEELNRQDSENNYYLYSTSEIVLDSDVDTNRFHKIENLKNKLNFYFKLPKILKKDKIDIYFGTSYILPKKNKNIKYYLTIHDLSIERLKNVGSLKTTIIHKLLLKKSLKRADKIIAVSNATKNDIIEIYKVPEEKIEVIYEGTNFDKGKTVMTREQEEKIEEKFKIIDSEFLFFLSTIEPRKNIETLIKAFEYVKEKKQNLKLIIAGGLGWKYENIINLYENSKFKDDIIMPRLYI